LLDEPLSSIDPEGKVEITRIISNLKKDRIIIATCHDPEIFLDIVDDIMVFGKGMYYVGKPVEVLNVKILERIYGDAIIKLKEHIHIYDHHN
jgi:zinc/manganese transport system ATP-binding protein